MKEEKMAFFLKNITKMLKLENGYEIWQFRNMEKNNVSCSILLNEWVL